MRITSRRKLPSTRVGSLDRRRRRGHLDGVLAEVRQLELAQQQAAVGVRVRAHPPLARRRECGQLAA